MRAIKRFDWALVLSLLVGTMAVAQQPTVEDCDALSQAQRLGCLGRRVAASQEKLRQAEIVVVNRITHWDEDDRQVRQAGARLAAAKREFAKFRELHCEFVASLGGGAIGSAIEARRLICVADLNTARAASLRDAVAELPLKSPR